MPCRRAFGPSIVGAVFALACGDHGTAPPLLEEESSSTSSVFSSSDIVVTTTLDIADFGGAEQVSDLPGPDGRVTLREAITAANNTTGPQVIGFNIPTNDPGFVGGVFKIRPISELPDLTDDGTGINGATQTAFSGNTNPVGPEVALDGSLLSALAGGNGLTIRSGNNRVHSLVINGFELDGCCDGGNGILIDGIGATQNLVTGCYLGTDASGSFAVANENAGVAIGGSATANRVGGTDPSNRNILSGNTGAGISITAEMNLVQGNFIGTDRTGRAAIGGANGGGVAVDIAGDNNTIGGPSLGARNVISGNAGPGVHINGTGGPLGNTVQGNFIGTDVTGRVALGNGQDGVRIVSDLSEPGGPRPADNNRIIGNLLSANVLDGVATYASNNNLIRHNLIFGNVESGVRLDGVRNTVSRNSTFSNGSLGIDLLADGVTPNDPGDGDAGPNNLQNFPVLTSATVQGGRLRVAGTIDTPNPATVLIEFFANPVPGGDPSGHGEGAIFLGTVHPNGSGSFNATLPRVPRGTLISGTATDAVGNTSEFAANVAVQ
jgi:parallel beta-helix repeat protein